MGRGPLEVRITPTIISSENASGIFPALDNIDIASGFFFEPHLV
jgi:hypothetical protein